jgi:hypothetical protein
MRGCYRPSWGTKAYGITIKAKLYAEDTRERFFHIYHGTGREHAEREQVELRMERMAKYLTRNEGREIAVSDTLRHYYDLVLDKRGCLSPRRGVRSSSRSSGSVATSAS